MTFEKHFFEDKVFSKKDYGFEFEPNRQIVNEILKFKQSGSIIDLGCGEAGSSLELAKRGFDVTCVDISKSVINAVMAYANKNKLKIKTKIEDLDSFRLNEQYDIIISLGSFHFLSKEVLMELIQNIKTFTNPGGLNCFEVLLKGDHSQEKDSEGYYFQKSELKKIYSDWKILSYSEFEENDPDENAINMIARIVAKNNNYLIINKQLLSRASRHRN